MCGITGFIDFNRRSDGAILDRMTDSLRHRGPDSRGTRLWREERAWIGLGNRRLKVIDLSEAASQPMQTEDGRFALVMNGELYNYGEIRAELEKEGTRFFSHSDTEVLLRGFARWGEAVVERFVGMFSFVLYDRESGEVWVFRDRAGVKSLYLYDRDGLFLFASELKALHEHPEFRAELSGPALASYLRLGYVPGPLSIFEHCSRLQPGERLRIRLADGSREYRRYWSIQDCYNAPKLRVDEEEAVRTTEPILQSACLYRMIADVPVGLFLSGGYDSSTVAAILQAHGSEKLRTFTIGFRDRQQDEAAYARAVARHLGTDHQELYCGEAEALEIVPELPEIYDEPFADSSAIPSILVSRMARRQVTVALSADAGDEVFGGYNSYLQVLRLRRWLRAHRGLAGSLQGGLLSRLRPERIPGLSRLYNAGTRYRKVAAIARARTGVEAQRVTNQLFDLEEVRGLLADGRLADAAWLPGEELTLGPENDELDGMMAADYSTYLPDDGLVKVDRATMSASLEGREPLLDHRLVEHVARLPSALKVRDGVTKLLMKRIAHRYLPQSMLERPKKGFSVPLGRWLRGALRAACEENLEPGRLRRQGLFDPEQARLLLRRVVEGRNENPRKLWTLLMFQMWYSRWLE